MTRTPKAKNLTHKINNTESAWFLSIYWKLHIEKEQRIYEAIYKNPKFDRKQILLSNALEAHSNLLFRNSMLHTLYVEAKKLHKMSIVKIKVYLL